MKHDGARRPRRVDLAVGAVLAALCLWAGWYLLLRKQPQGRTATVWIEGKAVMTIDLKAQDGQYISLEEQYGKPVHFSVKDGRVRFVDVDCPDQICVNTGWISEEGQTAICMPNKVSLTID